MNICKNLLPHKQRNPLAIPPKSNDREHRRTQLNKREHKDTFSNPSHEDEFEEAFLSNMEFQKEGRPSKLIPKRIFKSEKSWGVQKKKDWRREGFGLKGSPDRVSTQFVSGPMLNSRQRRGRFVENEWTQQIRGGTTRFSRNFDEVFSKDAVSHWRSNMDRSFSIPRKEIHRTRNDVYTRSYAYDEQSCLFRKTLDLSKIYADCPGMYSKRKNYIFWVIQSVKSFEFSNEDQILSRTVQILDFLFCKCEMDMIQPKVLTNIGVTCIWLAAKYEGVHLRLQTLIDKLHPNLKTNYSSMRHEMLTCENMVLKGIDFRISSPVHFDFVENYIFRIFYTKSEKYKSYVKEDTPTGDVEKKTRPATINNQNPEADDKKDKIPPISFEKFSKLMTNHRKKMESKNNISARQHWRKENKGVLVYEKLEQMLRKMVLYYLKVLYHTISSCQETQYGALACVQLAYEALECLPAEKFKSVKPTENDQILFFVQNSHFSKTENSEDMNSPVINTRSRDKTNSHLQENIKSLNSSRNKSTGVKNTIETESRHSSARKNSPLQFNSPKEFFNFDSKGHNSPSRSPMALPPPRTLFWKEPLSNARQERKTPPRVSFKLSQAKSFWGRQTEQVRCQFIKRQCMNFLYYRIYRITSKYFWSELDKIRRNVLKMEAASIHTPSLRDFFKQENPFSHHL
jgi:hypothetical protein